MTTASAPGGAHLAPAPREAPDPTPYPCEAFGDVLRHLRDARRLSQSKLAERAGLDHSFLSRLESGGRNPTRETLETIADALDATPLERFDLLVAAGYLPDDAKHFLTYWSRVPMATRVELTNLVMAIAEDAT